MAPEVPFGTSYARFMICTDPGYDSGIALVCSGRTGGFASRDATDLGEVRDGDSLETIIGLADEHRPYCEWAIIRDDERQRPELTIDRRARVDLRWTAGGRAGEWFAELFRLDHNVWDAWLYPEGTGSQPMRLMRNGTSYEMALMAVFRAMGDAMPQEFEVRYFQSWPRTGPEEGRAG